MKRGVFLAFEGIDGAGKTTQARDLKARLEAEGLEAVYVKEPTGGRWGRKVHEIAQKGRDGITAEEELDYYIRDREEDVRDNIAPALRRGAVVIADRYFYSTIAYQAALGLDPEYIRRRNTSFPVPDIVFLFDIAPDDGLDRITRLRMEATDIGYEQAAFQSRVKANFDAMTDPNIIRLDGGRNPDVLAAEVWENAWNLVSRLIL